jgi:hypothetical protein
MERPTPTTKRPRKMMTANNLCRHSKTLSIVLISLACTLPDLALCQVDSSVYQVDKKKLQRFVVRGSATYAASMTALYFLWYEEAEHQRFEFFNDNAEWKQMDKAGHFFSTFYVARVSGMQFENCGLRAKKAQLLGSLTAFGLLLPIEVFDGFSAAYGASPGDLVANAAGSAFYLGQQVAFNKIIVSPKISFHHTSFADRRPDLLGANNFTQIFKDYNGETFWLSVDIDKFAVFPKWLNIVAGYGADGMVYARDEENISNGLTPKRQYYLGLDFDLKDIRTRSKILKLLLHAISVVKLPAPALEFSEGKTKFHALYF